MGAFGPPAAHAAKAATATIPVVFTSSDPVVDGLVASLNRPGANVTGVNLQTADLEGKRLQLLTSLLPASGPIAVLLNPKNMPVSYQEKDLREASLRLGRQTLTIGASSDREIDAAFLTLAERRAAGLLVTGDPFFNSRRQQIMSFAASHAVPARNPTTGIAGCCACAASGHAAAPR